MNTVAVTLAALPATAAEGIREDLVRKLAERIRMQRLRHQMRRVRPDDRRRPPAGNDEPDAGPRQFTLHFPPQLPSASAGLPALRTLRVTGIGLE